MGFAHPQSGPRPLLVGMKQGARPGRLASRAALRSLTCRRSAAFHAETQPSDHVVVPLFAYTAASLIPT